MADALRIALDHDCRSYLPGDDITGTLYWSLEEIPKRIEVSLCWFTDGAGDEDAEVVASITIEKHRQDGEERFHFQLSDGPYSFSGNLISLTWVVEASSVKPNHSVSEEIVVSPTREEVLVREIDEPTGLKPFAKLNRWTRSGNATKR